MHYLWFHLTISLRAKKMIIITPTKSNNNHPNLKHTTYSQSFSFEPCLKLEIITFIGLPQ